MKITNKPIPPLPQRIQNLGITQAQWERAHSNPLVTSDAELAMALKISPRYLLPDDKETDNKIVNLAILKPAIPPDQLTGSDSEYGRKFPYIELDLVDPNPFQDQLRSEYDKTNVELVTEQLTDAFRKGDLRAFVLSVRKNPANLSRFQLVYGHLRLEAARRCGAKVLPAVVSEIADSEMLCQLVKENEQRCNPSIVSIALQVRFLVDHFNWNNTELSRLYNRSRYMMRNLYYLSYASKPFLEFVKDNEIFAHVISEMVKLKLGLNQQDYILQLLLQPGTTPGIVQKHLESLQTPQEGTATGFTREFSSGSKSNDIVEAEYFEYAEEDRSEVKYSTNIEKVAQCPIKFVDGSQNGHLPAVSRFKEFETASPKPTRSLYPTSVDEAELFPKGDSLFTPITVQEKLILEKLEADVRQVEQLAVRENISDEFRLKLVELIQRFTKI